MYAEILAITSSLFEANISLRPLVLGILKVLTAMLLEIQVCWDVNVFICTVKESMTACL